MINRMYSKLTKKMYSVMAIMIVTMAKTFSMMTKMYSVMTR